MDILANPNLTRQNGRLDCTISTQVCSRVYTILSLGPDSDSDRQPLGQIMMNDESAKKWQSDSDLTPKIGRVDQHLSPSMKPLRARLVTSRLKEEACLF
jgi:hypothetical protein